MPLGGLKWRDELEPKEFKKVKKEVQVLGIEDAPFEKDDEEVKVVAVLTRGAKMLDGVFHTSIEKDGMDATGKIIQLIRDIKRENARAVLLDGVTYGGFNTVDIKQIYRDTGIPVIVVMQRKPDFPSIRSALKNLDKGKDRWEMMRTAGTIHHLELDDEREIYFQTAGIKTKDAKEVLKVTTVNGLVPEPLRAAHMVAKGAYTDIRKVELEEEGPHVKAINYVKDTHKQVKRWKRKTFPGLAGEVFSFLFALLIAWLFIQTLGWMLATPSPLVVVESESMVHTNSWEQWHFNNNLNPDLFGFGGGMNVGDIVLVKGDDPDDIEVGDIIVYKKYKPCGNKLCLGGEPIIHRVIGIVEVDGNDVETLGAVDYSNGNIITPCHNKSLYGSKLSSVFTLDEIREIYSLDALDQLYPDMNLDEFRLFITKGDNADNKIEDQCRRDNTLNNVISVPIHEQLVQGRAKVDIPYLGYVKLGLVCAYRYGTGNACDCRCWWPADHPSCCK